jgi:hypothetical protein
MINLDSKLKFTIDEIRQVYHEHNIGDSDLSHNKRCMMAVSCVNNRIYQNIIAKYNMREIRDMNVSELFSILDQYSPIPITRYDSRIEYPVGVNFRTNIAALNKMKHMLTNFIKATISTLPISLCFRGSSGSIIASYVAAHLISKNIEVYLNYVKKDHEHTHDNNLGLISRHMWIIIDDFINTGDTVNTIYQTMANDMANTSVYNKVVPHIVVCCTGHIPIGKLDFNPTAIIANGINYT